MVPVLTREQSRHHDALARPILLAPDLIPNITYHQISQLSLLISTHSTERRNSSQYLFEVSKILVKCECETVR